MGKVGSLLDSHPGVLGREGNLLDSHTGVIVRIGNYSSNLVLLVELATYLIAILLLRVG